MGTHFQDYKYQESMHIVTYRYIHHNYLIAIVVRQIQKFSKVALLNLSNTVEIILTTNSNTCITEYRFERVNF